MRQSIFFQRHYQLFLSIERKHDLNTAIWRLMPQGFGLTDILGSLLSLQLNSKGSHTGNAFLCRTSVLVCKQLTIHYFSWRELLTLFWTWLLSQAIYIVMLLNWSTLWVLQPLDTVTVSKIPSDIGCKIVLILKLLRGRCKSYSHGAQGAQDWLMGLHGCKCAPADRLRIGNNIVAPQNPIWISEMFNWADSQILMVFDWPPTGSQSIWQCSYLESWDGQQPSWQVLQQA